MSLTFPSLFSVATNKETMMADYWNPIGEERGWSPLFARPFNDWEMDDVQIFLHNLQVRDRSGGYVANEKCQGLAVFGKAFLSTVDYGSGVSFPLSFCLELLGAYQSWLLHLGSFLGQSVNS